MIDYLIVGSGFAGSVLAYEIATKLNKKVLIIEQRPQLGGNCFDSLNQDGLLIHNYGPHIFHTDNQKVWDYLRQFTDWHNYQHEVLGSIQGKLMPVPFNLNSLQKAFPEAIADELATKLIAEFGLNCKIPIIKLLESQNPDFKNLADFIYKNVFLNYTLKQWGKPVEELDPAIFSRVPVYISYDNRYFQDKFQGLPKNGYAPIFQKMLNHPNIQTKINTSFKDVASLDDTTGQITFLNQPFTGKLIYTGLIDELFSYKFGQLPYRTLRFENETIKQKSYQPRAVVNYPNDHDFTRITEYKKLTGQVHSKTAIAKEYPLEYDPADPKRNIPYYPVFTPDNQQKYQQYAELAKKFPALLMVGRLAEYKYYDMDDIIDRALTLFETEILHATI